MKKLYFIAIILLSFKGPAQSFEGVYKSVDDEVHGLWMIQDGFSVQTFYMDSVYIRTNGGSYVKNHSELNVRIAFDDVLPERVGTEVVSHLKFEGENIIDDEGRIWIKQPAIESDLRGAYRITGRYIDGAYREINHTGSRMTLKMLADGYFQWIAFDSGTKQFFGTGGGDFTLEKGKYKEHILFFSRDNSRVGAELEFDGEIQEGDWHHKGKSSKGDPLHEVWTRL